MTFGQTTRVMGILNVTPDSFSDAGKFFRFEDALSHGLELARQGADILDIGGESTRPYAEAVSDEEEIRRVVPLIRSLCERIQIPISIDTTKAKVARAAIKAGASMINDVSALRFDGDMVNVAKEFGVPVVLMHMLGAPKTMQVDPTYKNVVGEIFQFLSDAVSRAKRNGISGSAIIVDPGIGFGKRIEHNLALIRYLSRFLDLGVPLLVGPSRKAFIRKLLKSKEVQDLSPDLPVVEMGTQAAVAACALNGAHIVRVHDVAATCTTLRIIDGIKNS
ncbi:MAG: dihydropteroate synthase [Pseudomonadota bacterium]